MVIEVKEINDITNDCTEVKSRKGRIGYTLNGEFVELECTICKKIKHVNMFTNLKDGFGKRHSFCKLCFTEKSNNYRAINPNFGRETYERNKESYAKRYQKNKAAHRESMIKHRKENPEWYREWARKDRKENPKRARMMKLRRFARKRNLPSDINLKQLTEIKEFFGNKCAISDESIDLHMDHVIPLAIGRGGTTLGNMIPLSPKMNQSKNSSHIFEWFDDNKERFNLNQQKFDDLIKYLAQVNNMTIHEYRAYVDWCFDNPVNLLLPQ